MQAGDSPAARQHGFTLLLTLAALTVLAIATQQVMVVVSEQARRDREEDLLRVGEAYARAIGSYYSASPGMVKEWPRSLKDLLHDKRYVGTLRHIRDLYPDPVTRSTDWGIIESEDGGISGVYSKSLESPIRTARINLETLQLPASRQYADWIFLYKSPEPAGAK
ncbi:MAG: hypothetical protein KF740_19965 [Ramlibacter sp.]|nr:hypothetical protein [Ramlibacter sp.]